MERWWKGLRIVPIEKQIYRCSCPRCKVPFEVPEDLPEYEEDYWGMVVFIAYCPICGQKLRFSAIKTPSRDAVTKRRALPDFF